MGHAITVQYKSGKSIGISAETRDRAWQIVQDTLANDPTFSIEAIGVTFMADLPPKRVVIVDTRTKADLELIVPSGIQVGTVVEVAGKTYQQGMDDRYYEVVKYVFPDDAQTAAVMGNAVPFTV